jgi:hypothetical protein
VCHDEPLSTAPAATPADDELGALVARARRGDRDALPRLRALLDDRPDALRRYGDLARHALLAWVDLAAGTDLALGEALRRHADALRAELAGSAPSPLEALLVDRVVVTWVEVSYADAAAARSADATLRQAEFALRRQGLAQRRHLAAVAALATARRLLARVDPRAAATRVTAAPPTPPVRADEDGDAAEGGVATLIPFDPGRSGADRPEAPGRRRTTRA